MTFSLSWILLLLGFLPQILQAETSVPSGARRCTILNDRCKTEWGHWLRYLSYCARTLYVLPYFGHFPCQSCHVFRSIPGFIPYFSEKVSRQKPKSTSVNEWKENCQTKWANWVHSFFSVRIYILRINQRRRICEGLNFVFKNLSIYSTIYVFD